MAPPSCPHHAPCLSHSVPCSGSCVADSGRVKLYGMDVVPDNLAPILSGENRGVGVCPYETFVWRDLTVQEHMLVMGMVYGAWVTCNPVPVELYPAAAAATCYGGAVPSSRTSGVACLEPRAACAHCTQGPCSNSCASCRSDALLENICCRLLGGFIHASNCTLCILPLAVHWHRSGLKGSELTTAVTEACFEV